MIVILVLREPNSCFLKCRLLYLSNLQNSASHNFIVHLSCDNEYAYQSAVQHGP